MKDNASVYSLYGLRLRSEIALPAPIAESELPPYDLQVYWGEPKALLEAPTGKILTNHVFNNGRGYTLVDAGSGYIYLFHHTAEFFMDRDLRSVRVHLAHDVNPEIAGLLMVGNVMACVLHLRGETVLHASAVEVGGSALAFLGNSGMGKSTLAALLCANGASFVTDDLLRLQADVRGWCCYPGTGELRLRKDATTLIEKFPATRLRTTADERVAIKMDDNNTMPPLGAIVVPYPSRSCQELKVERIPQAKALLYLMAYPRMWYSMPREHLQHRLDFLGRFVVSVPVFKAEIPWGLPFPQGIATSLIESVGLGV